MQLGSHFGKRKPRWNFFLAQHQSLKERYSITLKYVFYSLLLQIVILSPLIYWSVQNYDFFTKLVPPSQSLYTYLESERNWIFLIFFASIALTAVTNFFIFSSLLTRQTLELANAIETSPDEVVYQRHVS